MKQYQATWTAYAGLVLTLLGVSALADPVVMTPAKENKAFPSAVPARAGQPTVPPATAAPSAATPHGSPRQGFLKGRLRGKLRKLFHRGNP